MANVVWHMSATEKQLSYKLNINFFPHEKLLLCFHYPMYNLVERVQFIQTC